MKRLYSKAFTLLELMIVVAIIAVLTGLAYSSYTESVLKSNRGDAQATLTGFASAMQRFYTEKTPSTYVGAGVSGATTGAPASTVYANKAPLDGAKK